MRRRNTIALVFTACIVLALGCDNQQAGPTIARYSGPVNRCSSNENCPDSQTCHPTLKHCRSLGPSQTLRFAVRVRPKTVNLAETTTIVTLGLNGTLTPNTIHVPSPVLINPNPAKSPYPKINAGAIQARLVFTSTAPVVPGQPAPIYATTQKETLLPPGFYSLKITPLSDSTGAIQSERPVPYFYDRVEVTQDGALLIKIADQSIAKTYVPVPTVSRMISGAISSQTGSSSLPQNGIFIEALDPDTGRVISTKDTSRCISDQECGVFSIGIAASTNSYRLRMSRPEERQFPTWIGPTRSLSNALPGEDIYLGIIEIPNVGLPIRYEAKVERSTVLGDGTTIYGNAANCRVVFTSTDVAGGSSTFTVRTNEAGFIEHVQGYPGVNVYAGIYEITIVPPEPFKGIQKDHSVYTESPIEISTPAGGITPAISGTTFVLSERAQLEGYVVANERPVPNLQITSAPIGENISPSRTSSTITGSKGGFGLWLDPGNHRVAVRPNPASGYAWTFLEKITVDSGTQSNLVDKTISLNHPIISTLQLTTAPQPQEEEDAGLPEQTDAGLPIYDESNLKGAVVEWYLIEDINQPTSRLVAISTADEEGQVFALLPPS